MKPLLKKDFSFKNILRLLSLSLKGQCHEIFDLYIFSFQANTARSRTLHSVSLRGVGLRAVLVTFGSSENVIVDSAQC